MRKFKVGDRVAILATIYSINDDSDYPVKIKMDNSKETQNCTIEGKYHKHDTQQNVRHLEDLQYMYGKEMYVSSVEKSFKVKAYVIGKSNTGLYLYINIDDFEKYKHGVVVDLHQCKYVAELTAIPPRNLIRERDELLNNLADVIIEIQQSNNNMKTIIEILTQTPIYLHDWSDKLGLIKDFEGLSWLNDNDPKIEEARQKYIKYNILFASYAYANYSGDAFVLFEQDGKLYEVNGGHCSCYGLEGQFTPEETTLESIKHRLLEGTLGTADYADNLFASELKLFLGIQ